MLGENFTGLPILPLFPGAPAIPFNGKKEKKKNGFNTNA